MTMAPVPSCKSSHQRRSRSRIGPCSSSAEHRRRRNDKAEAAERHEEQAPEDEGVVHPEERQHEQQAHQHGKAEIAVRTTRSAPKRRMRMLLNWALPMNAMAFDAKIML